MSETQAPESAAEPAKTAEAAAAPAEPETPKAGWKAKGGALAKQLSELGRGLSSPDQPTRRMSRYFFASVIGVCAVFGLTIQRMVHVKQVHSEEDAASKIEQFLHKQEEEARRRFTMMDLGTFTLELKPVQRSRPAPGVVNMGEVTVVVQCDEPATQVFLEKNLAKVRSQITSVFTALDREELLSKDGKRRLKKQLMDRINAWLPSGKVVDVFFSNMIVS